MKKFFRKKRNNPYEAFIDFDTELTEYKLLCKEKGKKYHSYYEWKTAIMQMLSAISSIDALDNLKHYCVNMERKFAHIPNISSSLNLIIFTVFVENMFIEMVNVELSADDVASIIVFILRTIIVVTIVAWFTYSYIKYIIAYERDVFFYKDLIDLIDLRIKHINEEGVESKCQSATPNPTTKTP